MDNQAAKLNTKPASYLASRESLVLAHLTIRPEVDAVFLKGICRNIVSCTLSASA